MIATSVIHRALVDSLAEPDLLDLAEFLEAVATACEIAGDDSVFAEERDDAVALAVALRESLDGAYD